MYRLISVGLPLKPMLHIKNVYTFCEFINFMYQTKYVGNDKK